jgi:hypothetical protein
MALGSVKWADNIQSFLAEVGMADAVEASNTRLALWSKQFEIADRGNAALPFIREMQVAGFHVATLTALCLYKAAAGSMRAMCDAALYYSYYRTHPVELATLARDTNFYMEKRELLDFHRQHTADFVSMQNRLGLVTRLEAWYSFVSGIIHGQLPGIWAEYQSLAGIRFQIATARTAVEKFGEGVDIISRLFLCTAGRALWTDFSKTAKRQLLAGLQAK